MGRKVIDVRIRRANRLKVAFHQLLRDATDDPRAVIRFTHDWLYTNKHNALIHGLPQGLPLCAPHRTAGGLAMQRRLRQLIASGGVRVELLAPAAFAARRARAQADGRWAPAVRRRRADVGHPHARRKAYLWERGPPRTAAVVTEAMERGEAVYPVVDRPRRVSSVVRRRRAAREAEREAEREEGSGGESDGGGV